ncbi:MAG: alpha/beta fold hydrolase [Candidatus Thorarchaeota archaeon]|jgi:pimeloyl-ACP methyl ester carboxylesterase
MTIFLQIITSIVGFILLLFTSLFLFRIYLKFSTKIDTPNGISSLEEITLGGFKQWIFIRGIDQNNPVLIFLHGGPGEPTMGMSSSRKIDKELINHFTVVHWDQRGAGKSYNIDIPASSMTLNRLVEDCNELIDYLRNRLDTQKVFIVGHSGGTLIGLRTAHRYPEKIHAYVGVSQIINDYEQQKLSYEFIVEQADKSGDEKRRIAIEAIGPPPYDSPDESFKKDRYTVRYGGFMHNFSLRKMIGLQLNYLTSPEYSLSEGYRTIRGKGLHFTQNAMWDELSSIDFSKEIQSVQVPIYFFEGKYDMITPKVLVEDFYNHLNAEKGKTLVTFENSAHFLMIEEKEKYQHLLMTVVLKESQDYQVES